MKASLYSLITFLLLSLSSYSQSTTGTRGLVKAPTARMFEDGTLSLGAAFIPPGYFKKTHGWQKGQLTGNAGLNTFVTVNLFPFMEVMFRYSHEMNTKPSWNNTYFPDRMFTARFKLFKETHKLPALVLGMNDLTNILSSDAGTTNNTANYSSLYLVLSKQKSFNKVSFDISLGYGLKKFGSEQMKEFNGIFGGVEITTSYLKEIQFLIDYDTTYINIGVQKQFFNRIQTMVSYYPNYQKIGWVLAYRYKMY